MTVNSHEVTINLRGIEHTIRLPIVKLPTEIHVVTLPSDRDNDNRHDDNRIQRYGWIASAFCHACGLAAILWWPGSAIHQRASISGQRSVASIQLAFSAAAIAGKPSLSKSKVSRTSAPSHNQKTSPLSEYPHFS